MILRDWSCEEVPQRYSHLGKIWVIKEDDGVLMARTYDPDAEVKALEICDSHNRIVRATREVEERKAKLDEMGIGSRILYQAFERQDT